MIQKGDIVYLNEKFIQRYYKKYFLNQFKIYLNIPLIFDEYYMDYTTHMAQIFHNNRMICVRSNWIILKSDYIKQIRLDKLKKLKI